MTGQSKPQTLNRFEAGDMAADKEDDAQAANGAPPLEQEELMDQG